MFLTNREIELVKQAIEDYKFMKEESEYRISQGYSLKELADFISKFKDVEITNLEEHSDYGYLDFSYKDVDMCVAKKNKEGDKYVGKTFEIYDKTNYRFIVEDFLTIEEYERIINIPKEEMLASAIVDLKYYESNNKSFEYNTQVDKIIGFLKENW